MLLGRSPKVILRRLHDGDPLRLRELCERIMDEEALLLDLDRLQLRVQAHVAQAGFRYRGDPPLATFLRAQVDRSLAELLREDEFRDKMGLAPLDPRDPTLELITRLLGCEPSLGRAMLVTFNGLPFPQRRAFVTCVVEDVLVDDYAGTAGLSYDEVCRLLREVFSALSKVGAKKAKDGNDDDGPSRGKQP